MKSETSRLKLRSGPALGRKTKIENVRSELVRLVDEHAEQLRDKLSADELDGCARAPFPATGECVSQCRCGCVLGIVYSDVLCLP